VNSAEERFQRSLSSRDNVEDCRKEEQEMAGRSMVGKMNAAKSLQLDATQANTMWESLNLAIDQIFSQNSSSLSFEELYGYGYKLVIHKHGEMLYQGVQSTIRSHLLNWLPTIQNCKNDALLTALRELWDKFKVTVNNLKDVLMYMDRTFVVQHKKMPVYMLSLNLFREVIIFCPDVRERMQTVLLENIRLERTGELVEKELMKSALAMLVDLSADKLEKNGFDVYQTEFETPFL